MEPTEAETSESPNNKNLTMILGLVIVVILAAAALFMFNNRTTLNKTSAPSTSSTTTTPNTPVPTQEVMQKETSPSPKEAMAGQTKTVEITSKNFSFTPNVINAKVGDKIIVILKNTEGFHDFNIEGMNVNTKTIAPGQTDQVEFTASKVGTFEYYCSVGNHRKIGMVGKLIVE